MLRLDADQAVFSDGIKIADLQPEQFIFVNSVAAPAGSALVATGTLTPAPVPTPTPTPTPTTTLPAEPQIRHVSTSTAAEASKLGSAGIDTLTFTGTGTFKLVGNVENVGTTGRAVTVEGNALDNQITAQGPGYARLCGGAGNDSIMGKDFGGDLNDGTENDRLEVGKGNDFSGETRGTMCSCSRRATSRRRALSTVSAISRASGRRAATRFSSKGSKAAPCVSRTTIRPTMREAS